MRPGRMQRLGLLLLAASVPLWWAGLHLSTLFRNLFVSDAHWPTLRSVQAPDLVLAAVTALAAWRATPIWRGVAIGGWTYATAWTLAAGVAGTVRPLGVASMCAAMAAILVWSHEGLSARATRQP